VAGLLVKLFNRFRSWSRSRDGLELGVLTTETEDTLAVVLGRLDGGAAGIS
jgi:hypothetical protein